MFLQFCLQDKKLMSLTCDSTAVGAFAYHGTIKGVLFFSP